MPMLSAATVNQTPSVTIEIVVKPSRFLDSRPPATIGYTPEVAGLPTERACAD